MSPKEIEQERIKKSRRYKEYKKIREEEIQKRLGNLTVTPKKYVVQYEHNDGDSQYRDTYSFNKNYVSQVKTIYEIKEGLNYVIDKYGKYEADCVKEK